MNYRKIFSFPGVQIVCKVGVPGEKDAAFAVGADFGGDFFVQGFRTGKAQSTIHKVILIVDNKQIPVHNNRPFLMK